MAQINLGSIKFNWKGSYSGATAYVVDDVVESSGSSYICIAATTGNAPPNATYWEQMSSAGTNGTDGTDLGTTLTTQGDIVYRDASGLARLGAGTSGQFLKTQGTGANPVWGSVVAGLVQVVEGGTTGSTYSTTANTWIATSLTANITPTSSSNKILILAHGTMDSRTGNRQVYASIFRDSTNLGTSNNGLTNNYSDNSRVITPFGIVFLDTPNSTSQITYKVYGKSDGEFELNGQSSLSKIILMEVAV